MPPFFTFVLLSHESLQLYKPSHRAYTHITWPFSRQADLPCPCVLVVSLLAAHKSRDSKERKKKELGGKIIQVRV
jgi:hypothetical protein